MKVHRAASLNDSPIFIRAIADIAATHLADVKSGKKGHVSTQLMLRCPGCTNEVCGEQKKWLEHGGRG